MRALKIVSLGFAIGLLVTRLSGQTQKGFVVEGRPQEVLEKSVGVRDRYALIIGISKYANPAINLNFAASDALALNNLLLDPDVGGYKQENIRLLLDDQATRKNVISALKSWLGNRVKEDDSVLVFYSGHGALGNASEAYWVTFDADVEDLSSSAISNHEVSSLITSLPCRRKLTLIDSCYSEATAKKYRALVPTNIFDEFKGEGEVTITASTGQQKSVEVAGHGAFTYHLLDALNGKADANGNGVVEIDEIWGYLNERVQKTAADAGNKQSPVLMADRLEHGFPITINPAKAAGTVLTKLKQLYGDGAINADEMREADKIFTERAGTPELRKLYGDLADKVLPVVYFRQLRQALVAAPAPSASTSTQRTTVATVLTPSTLSAASATELEAFNVAQAVNSGDGWNRFLQQFPDGALATAARAKIEELEQVKADSAAYNMARQSDTEKVWEQYSNQFPGGKYIAEAQRRLAELKQKREAELAGFRLAEAKNNEASWERFLKEFPTGQLAAIAEDRLEVLRKLAREKENAVYAQGLKLGTLEEFDRYISAYPEGRFISDVTAKRAELAKRLEEERQRKIESDTYQVARTADTIESWSSYFSKYPDGPHTAESKSRAEQLNWIAFADTATLPAGSFMMGGERRGDEKPRHKVDLDAFRVGRAEVTNAQYMKFLDETKYRRPADPSFAKNYLAAHPDLPAVMVTYDDVLAFCKWLSIKTGATARLPTEAEWEYAALGGKEGRRFPWGTDDPKTKARFKGNNASAVKTVARDAFPPNGFGLYNMGGNVGEWVHDFYSEHYYQSSARKNPTGPPAGKERVVRGGSWSTGEKELECASREKKNPLEPSDKIGFRVVIIAAPYGITSTAKP